MAASRLAVVGKDTFEARTADLENPVEVFERECQGEALTQCGDGVRYQILRQIQIVAAR